MTRQPNLSEVTSELEPLYSRFWQTLKGFPNFLSQGSNNPQLFLDQQQQL